MFQTQRLTPRVAAAFVGTTVALLAPSASAGRVDLRFEGLGQGREVRIALDGDASRVFAGQLRWTMLGVSPDVPWLITPDLRTYCIEPAQSVDRSAPTYTLGGLGSGPFGHSGPSHLTPDAAAAIRNLAGAAGAAIMTRNFSDTDAAAFQLALWEIATDYSAVTGPGSLDLGAGRFIATAPNGGELPSTVRSRYADFVAAVTTAAPQDFGLTALMSASSQDQLTVIPSPAGAGLLCMGAMWMMRRRR